MQDPKIKLLIIDDNETLSNSLAISLGTQNIECTTASTGTEGLKLAQQCKYDAIVVDLMLPDIDGFQILLRLRALRINVPILIISGLSLPEQKMRSLASGANDYLTKPFNISELVIRIKNLCRRINDSAVPLLAFKDILINREQNIVTVSGREVSLTQTEYDILVSLIERKNTIVTKKLINHDLYKSTAEPKSKVLDVFICRLRDKLRAASGGNEYISTVWGIGYILREDDLRENEV